MLIRNWHFERASGYVCIDLDSAVPNPPHDTNRADQHQPDELYEQGGVRYGAWQKYRQFDLAPITRRARIRPGAKRSEDAGEIVAPHR